MFRKSPVEGPEDPRRDALDHQQINQNAFWTLGLTFGLAAVIAFLMPTPLIPAAFSSLLFYGAFGAAILALLRGERWNAPHVTAWDQTLALLFTSLLAGLFVDPTQVAALVEEGTAAEAVQ